MSKLDFEATHIEVFMGGKFKLDHPKTVGELRKRLKEIDEELNGWGDDLEITEVFVHNGAIDVTLSEGIPSV